MQFAPDRPVGLAGLPVTQPIVGNLQAPMPQVSNEAVQGRFIGMVIADL
jgi:hypothetical protein